MEYALFALGIVLFLVAFLGCVLPVLPGPVIAYCALLMQGSAVGSTKLIVGAVMVVAVEIADYLLPPIFARRFKCTGWGVFGCSVGTLVGIFFMPLGIVVGPFAGAVMGEIIAGRTIGAAMKGGFGALVGFAISSGAKLATVVVFAWWFVAAAL